MKSVCLSAGMNLHVSQFGERGSLIPVRPLQEFIDYANIFDGRKSFSPAVGGLFVFKGRPLIGT